MTVGTTCWCVIGPKGGEIVKLHQDASVFVSSLEQGVGNMHGFGEGRAGYLYVIAQWRLGDTDKLLTGDGVKVVRGGGGPHPGVGAR